MEWFDLVLLGLAVQRLTSLWFGAYVFAWLREWIAKQSPLMFIGANCGLCISSWMAAIAYGLWCLGAYGLVLLTILALGSLASFVNSWNRGT
jgi:hypothetical protein